MSTRNTNISILQYKSTKRNLLLLDNEVVYIMPMYVVRTHSFISGPPRMRITNANNDNTKHQTRTIFLYFIDKLFVGAFRGSVEFLSFSLFLLAFLLRDIGFVVPPKKIVIILLPLLRHNFDIPTISMLGQIQSKCGK